MALFCCQNSMPIICDMPDPGGLTRISNGNGSGKTAAYTVSIAGGSGELFLIVQYFISNATYGGWDGKGTVSAASNVEWLYTISPDQSNSDSLNYRGWKCVLVRPSDITTTTKVKFSTSTSFGKIIYYVYAVNNPMPEAFIPSPRYDSNLFQCGGGKIIGLKPITSSSQMTNSSSTTGNKTLSWTANKNKLYLAVELFLSNGSGSYTTFSAPTASSNVEWIYSAGTGSSTSDSLVCHAHRITLIKPAADGTCSINYQSKTSNGRIYYYVREYSPGVFNAAL